MTDYIEECEIIEEGLDDDYFYQKWIEDGNL